eukprot:2844910-Karenia_brevis.AAC.1
MSLSIFVLFIDLVAAFDGVVRELVMGLPHNLESDPLGYLCSLGLDVEVARNILEHIQRQGTAFEQMGVDQK